MFAIKSLFGNLIWYEVLTGNVASSTAVTVQMLMNFRGISGSEEELGCNSISVAGVGT